MGSSIEVKRRCDKADYDRMRADPARWAKYLEKKRKYQNKRYAEYRENNPLPIGPSMPRRERRKLNSHKYYLKHKDKIKARTLLWKKSNKEKVSISNRKSDLKNRAKRQAYWLSDKAKSMCRVYRAKRNKQEARKYFREYNRIRRMSDPVFKVKLALRRRMHRALNGKTKAATTMSILGISLDGLKAYLESKFLPGMSWDNYGVWRTGESMKWHIDHIKPCRSFDLLDDCQQRECFHYTNLQPLWALDNLKKQPPRKTSKK